MDVPTVIRILCGLSLDVNDVGLGSVVVGQQQEEMPHNKSQTSDEGNLGYQEQSVCAEDRLKKTHKHRRPTKKQCKIDRRRFS